MKPMYLFTLLGPCGVHRRAHGAARAGTCNMQCSIKIQQLQWLMCVSLFRVWSFFNCCNFCCSYDRFADSLFCHLHFLGVSLANEYHSQLEQSLIFVLIYRKTYFLYGGVLKLINFSFSSACEQLVISLCRHWYRFGLFYVLLFIYLVQVVLCLYCCSFLLVHTDDFQVFIKCNNDCLLLWCWIGQQWFEVHYISIEELLCQCPIFLFLSKSLIPVVVISSLSVTSY